MITLIIFLITGFILVIEAVSLWGNTRRLEVEFDLDTNLVEPGEIATLQYTVRNPHCCRCCMWAFPCISIRM